MLGSVESAPVRDQLALALTDSDNTLTEVLARQAARDGAATDFADVGAWIVGQVAEPGIDTQGVALSDASGLSRENRVTADLLTDVLVLGYDGQHRAAHCAGGHAHRRPDRHPGQPVRHRQHRGRRRRARAKTGTLTGANSLAGSVVDDDGCSLVYAGSVASAPDALEARAALDRFVAIAACGCR